MMISGADRKVFGRLLMTNPSWPSAFVAVAIIALVGLMFWKAVDNDFTTVWTGVGSVVGLVTGAIPAYFFHTEAQKAGARAEAIAAEASPDVVQAARAKAPEAFS
jgi:hypothetical protein